MTKKELDPWCVFLMELTDCAYTYDQVCDVMQRLQNLIADKSLCETIERQDFTM